MQSTTGVGDTDHPDESRGGSTTCGPYTLSRSDHDAMASNLVTSIGSGCSLATATSSTQHSHDYREDGGRMPATSLRSSAPATQFNAFYVYITNTTKGQGPNYVSGITITTAGSGYQPETPITLTGAGHRRSRRGQHQPWDGFPILPAGIRCSTRL